MRPVTMAAGALALAACAAPAHLPNEGGPAPQPPFVGGNSIRLLVDGPQAHGAMLRAMAAARRRIDVETYILDSGEVGERFAQVMERKAAEGVPVSLMYDAVGSLRTPREYFARLKKAGVRVCEFNPVVADVGRAVSGSGRRASGDLNNRNHRKITVVDGAVAFTGGINISEAYSYGSVTARRRAHDQRDDVKRGWRDTDVRIAGPVARQFEALFADAWQKQRCGPLPRAGMPPVAEARGDTLARVVSADPVRGTSGMYAALLTEIRRARLRVWLTVGYFVPDPGLLEALAAAARRGVDVRLVLPGFTDFWAPVYAGRSSYGELLEAGVRIYEWRQALMHAKTATVDGEWSSVGSTNLDWRSLVHNYEADLVVRDAAFARELERRFQLDLQASTPIEREDWERRGLLERTKEALARAWQYLL